MLKISNSFFRATPNMLLHVDCAYMLSPVRLSDGGIIEKRLKLGL